MANPKENRTQTAFMLIEQFLRKGYKCQELKDQEGTTLILTHEKKQMAVAGIPQMSGQPYKRLPGTH